LQNIQWYSGVLFPQNNMMKLEELSLLRDEGLSQEQIEKLKIVLAFYERLPSESMKQELLILMEKQPSMLLGEFDFRLDNFAARAKATTDPSQVSAYIGSFTNGKMH
jgi:hypothetical protein